MRCTSHVRQKRFFFRKAILQLGKIRRNRIYQYQQDNRSRPGRQRNRCRKGNLEQRKIHDRSRNAGNCRNDFGTFVISAENSLGDHYPQKPGADFRACHHRRFSRIFTGRSIMSALSRCKTLEGLVLSSRITRNAMINDSRIQEFISTVDSRQPHEEQIQAAQQLYFTKLICELFDLTTSARWPPYTAFVAGTCKNYIRN